MLYGRCSLHDPKPAETAQRLERRATQLPSFQMTERLAGLSRTRPVPAHQFPKITRRNIETKEKRHA
jgi:hypothetical protein